MRCFPWFPRTPVPAPLAAVAAIGPCPTARRVLLVVTQAQCGAPAYHAATKVAALGISRGWDLWIGWCCGSGTALVGDPDHDQEPAPTLTLPRCAEEGTGVHLSTMKRAFGPFPCVASGDRRECKAGKVGMGALLILILILI